jgi:hypothetical protein
VTDEMVQYFPYYRILVRWTKGLMLFVLQMAALNSFMLFEQYSMN